ncbi:MAG: hypothetical protein WC670_11235 [Pseudolabrys sp.]|jgi:hypothetical protein
MPRLRSIAAVVLVAATALPVPALAQQQQPPAAPVKPYKSVMVSPPVETKDADLAALRSKIIETAKARDRAALGRLVVTKNFFWEREGGSTAARDRPGLDILSSALGLSNKDAVGWDMLGAYADDTTASPSETRKGALCAPADPRFDGKAFDALLKDTQTDMSEWGYPLSPGIEVHATPQAIAPVVDRLGLTFVRVLAETGTANPAYLHVLTPSGKGGYVTIDSIAPLGNDQLCFVKEGGAWKIGGYIGAGEPQ